MSRADAPDASLGGETSKPRQIYDPVGDTPTSYDRLGRDAQPPMDSPSYKSTQLRHPKESLLYLPQMITEITGPQLAPAVRRGQLDNDLTRQHRGAPIGERIVVSGHVYDTEGKPLRDTLIEIWQANSCGRYLHRWDRYEAPLDPNFSGAGRTVTDSQGCYEFTTIKPGPYPWGNHYNAWRPAHIHFSLLGRSFAQRLVTQMYFPGDPFFPYDPIFNSVRDQGAREAMISTFSIHETRPNWAQAYTWDIYLRGPGSTPIEQAI
jgi:protocatechuate 3,4-dioxygenase, beta subunit